MAKETFNKVKENFKKNPRATLSLGAVGVAATVAVVGVLTGTVEPGAAIALFNQLLGVLTLGG